MIPDEDEKQETLVLSIYRRMRRLYLEESLRVIFDTISNFVFKSDPLVRLSQVDGVE